MNTVKRTAKNRAFTADPWWQLAENLSGRVANHIYLIDDTGRLAPELEQRGITIDCRYLYKALNTEDDRYVGPDARKLRALLRECETQLVMVVEAPGSEEFLREEGIAITTVTIRSLMSILDSLNVSYSYKTILSGDIGCFVVEGLGKRA